MGIEDYLGQESVFANVSVRCKREALSLLAKEAAQLNNLDAQTIEDALLEREKLGSTGIGRGVAIPHGKIEGLSEITALFVKLDTPVEFDSIDDVPVDLVFLLLAPVEATAAHLKALAKVTRLFRDEDVRDALRGADNAEALYAITTQTARSDAA